MRSRVHLGACRCLWEAEVCQHLLADSSHISWLQVECRGPRGMIPTDRQWTNPWEKGSGSQALVHCTPAPLETPAGLKLNTHLAHITSCPSKIFHYHSIGDIEGTVIAKTLQDWLSTLSAARVRKSSAYDYVELLNSVFSSHSVRSDHMQVTAYLCSSTWQSNPVEPAVDISLESLSSFVTLATYINSVPY